MTNMTTTRRVTSIDLPNGRALTMKEPDQGTVLTARKLSSALSSRRSTLCKADVVLNLIHKESWAISKDHLEFGSIVGEGAMAVVLKAKFRGQVCAAKMLKCGVSHNSPEYNDLISELSILTSVGSHRNLVRFYGACIDDPKTPVVVQELVDGPDLETFLTGKHNGFNLGKTIIYRWTHNILSALHHLHDRDPIIMHRDLKPANILISGNTRTLKLADFGLAKQLSHEDRMEMAHAGNTGTLRYMAPEVVGHSFLQSPEQGPANTHGHGDLASSENAYVLLTGFGAVYTEKADIYSAALITWYLLTGMKPYIDIRRNPLARPSLPLAGARCPDLAALLEHMWHSEPERRPSAGECLAYLESLPVYSKVNCCSMQ